MLGTADGRVEKYNMQSGILRGLFGHHQSASKRASTSKGKAKDMKPRSKSELTGHTSEIQGIAIDGLNRYLVTGCLRGKLKVSRDAKIFDRFGGDDR